MKSTAKAIQDNLHRLAVNLRPASLDHLGLVTTVQQFIQEFSRQYAIPVEFEAVGMQDKRCPIEIETALFRIVQESLTNVVLHAQATRVDVLLSLTDKRVSAIVEDDGIGFIPALTVMEEQLGLFGMRERIEMLGGTLTIESSPGKGTTVKAEGPVMIRVLIADDHAIVRAGLRALIHSEATMELVGEAAGGYETIDLVEKTQPDVLVLDLSMPDLDGIAVTRQDQAAVPQRAYLDFDHSRRSGPAARGDQGWRGRVYFETCGRG